MSPGGVTMEAHTLEPTAHGLPFGLVLGVSAVVLSLSVIALLYKAQSSKATGSHAGVGVASKAAGLAGKKAVASENGIPDNRPRVKILYGTQTGTAERFSKQLSTDLRKKYGDSVQLDVIDLENYSPADQLSKEKLAILCVATYGDGEPTDNAADFFTWLAKETEAVEAGNQQPLLQGLSYAVFGLGNKQYEHFNAMGKKAHKQLAVLGANPVVRRGDGDDDGCIDDDFDKWSAELYAALDSKPELVGVAQSPAGATALEDLLSYDVEVIADGSNIREDPPFPKEGSGKTHNSPYWATITTARELHTPQSGRSCVHAEIDIGGAQAGYTAGDHIGIHAANSEAVVEEVAGLLGLPLGQLVRLSMPAKSSSDRGLAAPPAGVLSVRSLLAWHYDLLSSPHKEALTTLARCATDADQAARLARLAAPEGKQEYGEWIAKPHRSLLEVMREFPSVKPPLGVFLAAVAPRLQPRFYSISSSAKQYPNSVHVTCAVVRETMPTGRIHEGVASTWLQRQMQASTNNKVPVFLRSSHFKLPQDPSKPVVMVGPGTGLAPFRGFLQERAALRSSGASLGPAVLFFGCRSKAADYIYEDELANHLAAGDLSELHVAFSRDAATKDYVQHHMERQAARLWELLGEQGGYLYVCGDAKHMAKDVHRTLVGLVSNAKGCSGTQAEGWVKELQDSGRYQRDVW